MNRRDFLLLLGAGGAGAVFGESAFNGSGSGSELFTNRLSNNPSFNGKKFQPIRSPIPLMTDGITPENQPNAYLYYEVQDDLVLPEGYGYRVVVAWGEPIGETRCGFNNDYLAFVPTGKDRGLLTINFEYISFIPWKQSFQKVTGQSLPFDTISQGVIANQNRGFDVRQLPDQHPLKAPCLAVATEAMTDLGIGIIEIQRNSQGIWERTYSSLDRRITGISGYQDQKYLKASGPAAMVFRKSQRQGYDDGLGSRIIGTFGNCAGGITPWGTVLSAEENFQNQVTEVVYADGSSFAPDQVLFRQTNDDISGLGNPFGLAGNKYGWIVEVDPANPQDQGTKHTWLGRYRHEAVGVRVLQGKPLAFYSGCDRHGGHIYKFVSRNPVLNSQDKSNSQLLSEGMLYVAKFNPDGTGTWLALNPEAKINPDLPSDHWGGTLHLPKRPTGGVSVIKEDAAVREFAQKFLTLGDLYTGSQLEKQGAILIDAHYAANAIGATGTARPEDTEIAPDGSLIIAFTSGNKSRDGSSNRHIFHVNQKMHEYGWLMRLTEANNDPAAMNFTWQMLATGGEPATGGLGFANPDNIAFDPSGNLWMVTDISTDKLNRAVADNRVDSEAKPLVNEQLNGIYGNNSIWFMPMTGKEAGKAFLFGYGPMECETTGPFFTADQRTLFLSIQHPGEFNGVRQDLQSQERNFSLQTTDGKAFSQTRLVPVGSNWYTKQANDPCRPAVVAIFRFDGTAL